MAEKGIRKIREGLKLIIEGKIDTILELKEDMGEPAVRDVVEMNNREIQEYFSMAEKRYSTPEEDLQELKTKYCLMKVELALKI